jgi:drug/metabolite transporter (DMT)-like permease
MKKTLLLTLAMFTLTAGLAHAGALNAITGYIKGEALSLVIGGIIGALGAFGASYKLWGKAVKELGDFIWAVYSATRPNSNAGKEITKAEMEKIIKEASEIYPAVASAIAIRKKD